MESTKKESSLHSNIHVFCGEIITFAVSFQFQKLAHCNENKFFGAHQAENFHILRVMYVELNGMTLMQHSQSHGEISMPTVCLFAFMNSQMILVKRGKGADTTEFSIYLIFGVHLQRVWKREGWDGKSVTIFGLCKVQCKYGKLHVVSDTINYDENGEPNIF